MRLTHGSDHPRLPTFLRSILPPGRQHDFLQVQGGRTEGNARRRKRRSASYCRWRAVGGSALPACGLSLLPPPTRRTGYRSSACKPPGSTWPPCSVIPMASHNAGGSRWPGGDGRNPEFLLVSHEERTVPPFVAGPRSPRSALPSRPASGRRAFDTSQHAEPVKINPLKGRRRRP